MAPRRSVSRAQSACCPAAELKCAAHDEALIRAKLLKAMRVQQLRLHGLESHCIAETGNVEVEAVVDSNRQEDRLVEGLVGELSLSPRIFSTSSTSTSPAE